MSSIPGNSTTGETLDPGEVVNTTIDAGGDRDWFRVSLTSGLSYGFRVESNGGPGIGMPDPDINLYNNSGVLVEPGSNSGSPTSFITFSPTLTGNYFVEVTDAFDTGGYRLSWVSDDNVVNNTTTTRTLTEGTPILSSINVPTDSDWYRVTLQAGLSYGFLVESRGGTGVGAPDPDIYLHNSLGVVVQPGSNSGSAVQLITYDPTASGTYFVSVSDAFDTGLYRLSWVGSDTIVNNTSTTQTLARNSSITSAIDVAGDQDVFRVTLEAGISYAFGAARAASGGAPDPDIYVQDSNGNPFIFGNNSGSPINIVEFTPTASGTYYIEVTDGFDFGRYVLSNIGLDTIKATTGTTTSLGDGRAITGGIECNGDNDWVRFRAEAGVTYTFTLSGNGSSTEIDLVRLFLRDANGTLVTSGAGGDASVITFVATSDQTLYLDLSGFGFDDIGGWRLSVVSNAPTLTGTAGVDRLVGGSTATVINGLGGNDVLDGGGGDDKVFGNSGNDVLNGGDGNDTLSGGDGNDALSGGANSDRLLGGAGNDVLRGGSGADRFVFAAREGSDVVKDWQDASDRIEITSGANRFADLAISQAGDNVRISFGGTVILVENALRSEFTASDFIFS